MAIGRVAVICLSLLATAGLTAQRAAAQTGDLARQTEGQASDVAQLREDAEGGSLDAMLKLGLAYDLGTGIAQDRDKAFDWYLTAAEAGQPDAQFNVAVMLDQGATGDRQSLRAAGIWYARAAAKGQPRAQYALAMLYDAGDGVPVNPDIAAYWYGAAADTLSAAADKLASRARVATVNRTLVAPELLSAEIVRTADRNALELVWTAPAGPEGASFLVEIAEPAPNRAAWTTPYRTTETLASSLVVNVPADRTAFAWRVIQSDQESSARASSGWAPIGDAGLPLPDDDVPVSLRQSPTDFRDTLRDIIGSAMR